jgi:hypothetical protein
MAWIEQDVFKSTFRQASRANDNQIQMAYDAAEDELSILLDATFITDAKAAEPTVAERSNRIIRAHSYLAYSIHLLNIRDVKKEQSAASPATQQVVTNEYYTPKELIEMSDDWRARAMKAINAYLTVETAEEQKPPQNYTRSVDVVYRGL